MVQLELIGIKESDVADVQAVFQQYLQNANINIFGAAPRSSWPNCASSGKIDFYTELKSTYLEIIAARQSNSSQASRKPSCDSQVGPPSNAASSKATSVEVISLNTKA